MEIELPITFRADRTLRRAQQRIVLTPVVEEAEYAVSATTVPVVHWIVEAVASGMIARALRGPFDFAPLPVPVPQTVIAEPNALSPFTRPELRASCEPGRGCG